MKGRIVITTTGQIRVFTDEGSFAEGADVIKSVFDVLKANGIELSDVTPVEQHRHDANGNHISGQAHTHADGSTHTH